MGLYQKHRPKSFKELIGQSEAAKVLAGFVTSKTIPHAILFSGPSGVGKTTAARILRRELGCSKMDFEEKNAASERGIDMVREIEMRMGLAPLSGKCRVWLIDEAARMTADAQSALLKILEDTPDHCYFFLATTDPDKLLKTIRTRCTPIAFKPLVENDLRKLLGNVCALEKLQLSSEVAARIVEAADGSARQALVLLEKVSGIESEEEKLNAIASSDVKRQAFDIVKALVYQRATWDQMATILKNVDTSDPERLRHFIMACATTELLKGGRTAQQAFFVLQVFGEAWYDRPKAGLAMSCYEVLANRK